MNLKPIHYIKLPIVRRLKQRHVLAPENILDYFNYPITDCRPIYPKTFVFDISGLPPIHDFFGTSHATILIIENRDLFMDGDSIIVQTVNGAIYLGEAKYLGSELLIENKYGPNHQVLSLSEIRYIGRLMSAIREIKKN
ncbi:MULTISPECIES: hypothetical protein [unclassified Sporolactobacillus]|uniref:hypothetical protein n=1 Tax=unclassified Sporolactobacillus TaxID=2628533 RepID=UPI002368B8BC|nr:hypothetical protein [Sporolactobacillus sp. CQH2019]MDD9147217.1 hypothetical protein [Sporolactobacillus sp. CQH2019]